MITTSELNRINKFSRENTLKDVIAYFHRDVVPVMPFTDMFPKVLNLTENEIFPGKAVFLFGHDARVKLTPDLFTGKTYPQILSIATKKESEVIQYLRNEKVKRSLKVGFGWGAHLLAAINGATILQSVKGHERSHPTFVEGIGLIESPAHHTQAISLYKLSPDLYHLIAYAFCGSDRRISDHQWLNMDIDVEMIYFPATQSLCIEGIYTHISPPHDYLVAIRKVIHNLIQYPHYYGEKTL